MPTSPSTVFGALSASPTARVLHRMDLGFGCAGTIWSNSRDRVAYTQPEGHTLSLYLQGGQGTRRLGRLGRWHGGGHPGAVCIMPQGHCSEWEITEGFAFVHLYLPDTELRRLFAECFDRDARLMVLPELTFGDAPSAAAALGRLASALGHADMPAAEAAMTEAVVATLALDGARRPPPVKGGLAPHLCRRVVEHIEAGLDQPLRLQELAALAGMSAFHFQRTFRTSHGVSPQGWILRRRIARARAQLRGAASIAQVAAACGFSSQSHLTRAFHAATGTTPAAYRKLTSPASRGPQALALAPTGDGGDSRTRLGQALWPAMAPVDPDPPNSYGGRASGVECRPYLSGGVAEWLKAPVC